LLVLNKMPISVEGHELFGVLQSLYVFSSGPCLSRRRYFAFKGFKSTSNALPFVNIFISKLSCALAEHYTLTQLILIIKKLAKKSLLKRKSRLQTAVCIRERNFIMGHVAGTVFQLSSRLPLLSPFSEATEIFLSACFSHGEIIFFRLPSCLVTF
jgi:hypothetical protein